LGLYGAFLFLDPLAPVGTDAFPQSLVPVGVRECRPGELRVVEPAR
jgi:hypothetical protein